MTDTPQLRPDDRCGVCNETRENHGDKFHTFDSEGMLRPLKPGPVANNVPPEIQGTTAAITQNAFLRLIESLIKKGVLEGEDLVRIFGGDSPN